VRSRRGHVVAPARIGGIEPGLVFLPMHYGSWDADGRTGDRAANELTITGWDPVSKQPWFKYAAVAIRRVSGPDPDMSRTRNPDLEGPR
jgi:anaerobic selenocysteine-containing dehydrogenase